MTSRRADTDEPQQMLLPDKEWLRRSYREERQQIAHHKAAMFRAQERADASRRMFELYFPGEQIAPESSEAASATLTALATAAMARGRAPAVVPGVAQPAPIAPDSGIHPETIADAAERVLEAAGRALNVGIILEGVRLYGVMGQTANRNSALSTITSALLRDRRKRFVRALSEAPNTWALREWGGDEKRVPK